MHTEIYLTRKMVGSWYCQRKTKTSRDKGRGVWPGEGVGFELSRRRGLLLVLKTKAMKDLVYIGWYVKIV